MTDHEIVKALIGRDSRVTAQFFFKDCRPLMLSIIHRVFDKQKVDYDEVISELYIYLMANDAHRLRQFKFESTLYQWLKTTTIRFCLKLKTDGMVIDNESQEPLDNRNRHTDSTESSQAKMDVDNLLCQMKNQRYAKVIRMLMLEDMTPDEVGVLVISALFLVLSYVMFIKKSLDRTEGAILLLIEAGYMWYLIANI